MMDSDSETSELDEDYLIYYQTKTYRTSPDFRAYLCLKSNELRKLQMLCYATISEVQV